MWIDILRMSNKWNVARAVLDGFWLQSLHNLIKKLLTSFTLNFQNNLCCLLDWKPFKSDEKCFLFLLKSSFSSQDIYFSVTTFWSYRKNGLIKKIRLTSKPGLETIAIHILPSISESKDSQTMKLGQLIEYNKRGTFFKNYAENEAGRLVWDLFLFFWKSLIWGESKWSAAKFRYISIALNLQYNESKLYKTLDYWSRDMLNFNFSEKGLGLVSPPHFVNDFWKKCFSCYLLLIYQISLSDCLYFWRYWTICALKLFVNQAVASKNLKLTYLFNEAVLIHDQKVKTKN